jgi:GT2 family glycosyltransferase
VTRALVSVIVPCYNQDAYLADAIRSLVQQSHTEWECIIVNDGSTDRSLDVARRLAGEDSRVRVIDQHNRGLSAARNRGLAEARGDWIHFLDADDLLERATFATHLEVFRSAPETDVAYSASRTFREGDPESRRLSAVPATLLKNPLSAFALYWERGLSIPIHAFTYRTLCFQRWGAFDEQLPNHEDWDIHLTFSAAGTRYTVAPRRSAIYRLRPGSMARQADLMYRGKCMVLSKHLSNPAIPFRLRRALAGRLVHERYAKALEALRRRQWRSAVRHTFDRRLAGKWSLACAGVVATMLALRVARTASSRVVRRWLLKSVVASGVLISASDVEPVDRPHETAASPVPALSGLSGATGPDDRVHRRPAAAADRSTT